MKMSYRTCRLIWAVIILVSMIFVGSVIGIGGKTPTPATTAPATTVANGAGAGVVANAEPIVVPAKPTPTPTQAPTAAPTQAPTAAPTQAPTAVPTAAPTVAPTQAPTALPTAAPTLAPTAAPTPVPTVAPTATPTAVLTSTEASQLCIRKDEAAGKQWTMFILRNDLEKVKYEEIKIQADAWNGVDLLANSKGAVGEVWGLEKYATSRRNAGTLKDFSRVKREWLNSRGEIISRDEKSGHCREGYAELSAPLVHVDLPYGAVRFVRLDGETNLRMVVVAKGTPYNWGDEGGNKPAATKKPAATQAPTAKPTQAPTAKPTAKPNTATPAPEYNATPTPAPTTPEYNPTPAPEYNVTPAPESTPAPEYNSTPSPEYNSTPAPESSSATSKEEYNSKPVAESATTTTTDTGYSDMPTGETGGNAGKDEYVAPDEEVAGLDFT